MMILRELTASELHAYKHFFVGEYAEDLATNYGYNQDKALSLAQLSFEQALPDGINTAENKIYCIENDHQRVGYLWYSVNDGGTCAFIKDFCVLPEFQQLGYGKRSLQILEQILVRQGIFEIKLRVAADNPRAKKLYEQLAFVITGYNMAKTLKSE
ncbi:acetyltransferase (GNAT) family protein [Yersinia ruckeri]|uniref:GNAT family N-acetyltransferase n=1 Tax=Yersinia ruckeri TaxID=29486 RepID=UPI0005EA19A4|nr:GNAT family N-acetyltransferase [Yersinia ruckeri]EKN4198705.1 GNAT family N-acetyltransferase [Yersinia ruckeri]EKN4199907.1 GNAT family N-acetyltransferase [Yersinia ruckeri]EKN4205319.1 GNAT family N-acetyltransferase [Yersinia ruckeri]EKN4206502.1 GNAT family N-acetyltransferase [Yersinia ruckeri]EKN4702521.1 GNAT family N-acetyltransferase [Yersinia ruckeri]